MSRSAFLGFRVAGCSGFADRQRAARIGRRRLGGAVFAVLIASAGLHAGAPDLYVAGFFNDAVLRYDGQTGDFLGVFTTGGPLELPRGLAFGPDGHLYVANLLLDQIEKYDGQTGEFLGVFAADPRMDGPEGIGFGPNGNLYVVCNNTDNVVEFDGQSGQFVKEFSGGGLDGGFGMCFSPRGTLMVATSHGRVLEYDPDTGDYLGDFADDPGRDVGFNCVFGPNGRFYATESTPDQVREYDGQTGEFLRVFASGGGLSDPHGLVFGPNGNLFVCSSGSDQVLEYDGQTGEFLGVFAEGGGLNIPTLGIAFFPLVEQRPGDFDGDGDVDIADFAFFSACFTGSGVPCEPPCCQADLDGDGDVDIADFAIFSSNFTGSQ